MQTRHSLTLMVTLAAVCALSAPVAYAVDGDSARVDVTGSGITEVTVVRPDTGSDGENVPDGSESKNGINIGDGTGADMGTNKGSGGSSTGYNPYDGNVTRVASVSPGGSTASGVPASATPLSKTGDATSFGAVISFLMSGICLLLAGVLSKRERDACD